MLDGGAARKRTFTAGPGGVGASAYQDWLTLPGNAGKSKAEFIAAQKGADGKIQSFLRPDGTPVSKAQLTLDDIGALAVDGLLDQAEVTSSGGTKQPLPDVLAAKLDGATAGVGLVRAKSVGQAGTVYAQVNRPIEAFYGDMVNLADEGALGNDLDVAANDTAIARALARCNGSSARPILIPPGIYRANPFKITQSGVSLHGLGEGASLFRPQGNGDFISLGSLQTITRKVGVFGIGGLYGAVPGAGSSFIHVHGASQVDIDRVQCGDPTIPNSGGRHFIVVDNYGNGAQVFIQRIKGVNYAGDGLAIGPLSRSVPNEIHVGQTALAGGSRGLVVYYCSGLYIMGGYVSIFNMANIGVGLIPGALQADQYPGMDPTTYPQNIYGADLFGVNADTCVNAGFYLGGTGTIAELLMAFCVASSCFRGVDATATSMAVDDWLCHGFKGTNCKDWGFIVNSPYVRNWMLSASRFWCNNTLNSNGVGGVAVANASTWFKILATKSGLGGWLGRGGTGAPAFPNYQKLGFLVDDSCDQFEIDNLESPGNATAYSLPAASGTKKIGSIL